MELEVRSEELNTFPPTSGKALPSNRAMRRRREQTARQMIAAQTGCTSIAVSAISTRKRHAQPKPVVDGTSRLEQARVGSSFKFYQHPIHCPAVSGRVCFGEAVCASSCPSSDVRRNGGFAPAKPESVIRGQRFIHPQASLHKRHRSSRTIDARPCPLQAYSCPSTALAKQLINPSEGKSRGGRPVSRPPLVASGKARKHASSTGGGCPDTALYQGCFVYPLQKMI